MDDRWERETLREVLLEHVNEQRRARRWRLGMRLGVLALVILAAFAIPRCQMADSTEETGPHTAQVWLEGPIMADTQASADQVISGLRRAFEAHNVQGVVLRINSPGGSPVHSRQIHEEIRALREAHPDVPLHAVIEDIGASGAYYVASAAETIHVDRASLLGSIGVVMGSFGVEEAMEKLGIERRIYTAGENKAFMDPFAPEKASHVEHLQNMLDQIHEQFIEAVLDGRGDRLASNDPTHELFSGLVWTGEESIELGLADEIGSIRSVARDVFEAEDVVDYTAKRSLLARLADRLGASAGRAIHASLRQLETPTPQ